MKTSISISAALILMAGAFSAQAVDPLPPELEHATLEKQAEYWQRTSRDSGELRAKVAQERYQAGLSYKRVLQSQMEENLAHVEAKLEISGTNPGAAGVPQEEETSWGLYALLGGLLAGGAALINHQMKTTEQPA